MHGNLIEAPKLRHQETSHVAGHFHGNLTLLLLPHDLVPPRPHDVGIPWLIINLWNVPGLFAQVQIHSR